jgi:membrane-associated phospholipid phosphatase
VKRAIIATLAAGVITLTGCTAELPTAARTEKVNQPQFALALTHTLTTLTSQQRLGPLAASRLYGYSFAAAWEAYEVRGNVADAATAAQEVAKELMFNTNLPTLQLDALARRYAPDGPTPQGSRVAQEYLTRASDDGYEKAREASQPISGPDTFDWEPTGMARVPFTDPGYGTVTPLVEATSSCDIPAPDTVQIASEVRSMFKNFDPGSTATELTLLFLAGIATPTPSGQMLQISANATIDRGFDERRTLQMLAAVSVAAHDAGIAVWREKREHMIARPETLYQRLTDKEIFLPRETPSHPSYPSGHSGFSGGAVAVLEAFLGEEIGLYLVAPEDLAAPRARFDFAGPDQLLELVNQSRIDAGFHTRTDVVAGASLGRCIGAVVVNHFLEGTQ